MLKEDYKIYEGKMKKSIDSVAADFASVRAGRANAPPPSSRLRPSLPPTPGHC